jgi:hypothetical protein
MDQAGRLAILLGMRLFAGAFRPAGIGFASRPADAARLPSQSLAPANREVLGCIIRQQARLR